MHWWWRALWPWLLVFRQVNEGVLDYGCREIEVVRPGFSGIVTSPVGDVDAIRVPGLEGGLVVIERPPRARVDDQGYPRAVGCHAIRDEVRVLAFVLDVDQFERGR
jgi:hypothetical protein